MQTDVREALAELVALKDLKDKAERGVTVAGDAEKRGMCASFQEQSSALAEYRRRKPLAWAAARAALAASPQVEPVAHICILPTKDAGPTKFFTSPSDPRGFPVYASPTPAQAEPEGWADVVEQRLLTWRQRFVNRSGDQLALDDFMGQESIDDLVDFVCSPIAAAPKRTAG